MSTLFQYWQPKTGNWRQWASHFPKLVTEFEYINEQRRQAAKAVVPTDVWNLIFLQLLPSQRENVLEWFIHWITHPIEQLHTPLRNLGCLIGFNLEIFAAFQDFKVLQDYKIERIDPPLPNDAVAFTYHVEGSGRVIVPRVSEFVFGVTVPGVRLSFPNDLKLDGTFSCEAQLENGQVFYYHPLMPVLPMFAIIWHGVYMDVPADIVDGFDMVAVSIKNRDLLPSIEKHVYQSASVEIRGGFVYCMPDEHDTGNT
jgi:hypothetical protein